jgi:hypothetical protein
MLCSYDDNGSKLEDCKCSYDDKGRKHADWQIYTRAIVIFFQVSSSVTC